MPTLIVYPDPSTGGTTVDGYVSRNGSANETFATITSSAGTQVNTVSAQIVTAISSSATVNQFGLLRRGILTFDTSSIPSTAIISSATFAFVSANPWTTGLGVTNLAVVSAAPAVNNNLSASDYSNLGSTLFGSIAPGSVDTGGVNYNNITLNVTAINPGGITGLGTRMEWDRAGSFTGTWASIASNTYQFQSSDNAGTSTDPKLTVVYTLDPTVLADPDFSHFPRASQSSSG